MKCDKCGKAFQTYSGICPFCHAKNEKDTQERPTIEYTPIVKPNPPVDDTPRNSTEIITPYKPVRTGKTSDNTSKYVLTGGIVLVVILLAAVMIQAYIGGSSSTPNQEINYAPTPTDEPIPSLAPIASSTQPKITYSGSKAGTLSPYSVDPNSITPDPHATKYVAPGYRRGEDPPDESGIMVLVTPYPIVTGPPSGNIGNNAGTDPSTVIPNPPPVANNPPPAINNPVPNGQSWTSDDIKFVRYFYAYMATIQRHSTDIVDKAVANDTVGVRYASDRLKRTTEEGIANIQPLSVSSPLTETRNGYLSWLHSMALGSDKYITAMDAYERGDTQGAEILVAQGAAEFNKAGETLQLITRSLPKELAEPY